MAVEFICDNCGKREAGTPEGTKPSLWFVRTHTEQDESEFERRSELHACSRECAREHMVKNGHRTFIAPW